MIPDRNYWAKTLYKVCHPMLSALANGQLKATMPVEGVIDRSSVSHLEAFGRGLAGLAPWLEAEGLSGEEAAMRDELRELAQKALHIACDPDSPDFLNFNVERQPLVDAAFLAHAILRAPRALWDDIPAQTQQLVIDAMRSSRVIMPGPNNWLLFAAMVETLLYKVTGEGDPMRIDYALRQHEQWYKGDGTYGDGANFHWDYYNSYVIQPMLLDITATLKGLNPAWDDLGEKFRKRAGRYAMIQERMIAPDGSFPVIGRSIAYRCGAFQLLAQVALQEMLPESLPPAQVRSALTAVIHRTMNAEGTFDANGWLTIGLSGHQPGLGEPYISTGSLYLCTFAFLPLGLSPSHRFWSDEAIRFTSERVWSGDDLPADKAQD